MKLGRSRQLMSLARQLRSAWQLAAPYLRSNTPVTVPAGRFGRFTVKEKSIGRTLLGGVVLIEVGQVYLYVLLNEWNARFFNAIQDKNMGQFWKELAIFGIIAAAFIVVMAYQVYLNQWLQIRWRAWMTGRYLDRWLSHGVHYRMRLSGDPADNPDQRIADDVEMFVERTLSLGLGFLSAIMVLTSFVVILWGLSRDMSFSLGGYSLAVPGLLVWLALAFALLGTVGTHWIGWPLVSLNFARQRYEADFRFALVRLRENSEPIALARGESTERSILSGRFANVTANWYETMSRQKKLTFLTSGYNQVAVVLPTIIVAPQYFAGLIPLGTLMQTGGAFGQVQTALSFFVDAYARLAQWKSVVDRLVGFETQIALAANLARQGLLQTRNGSADTPLVVEDVHVQLPGGAPLLTAAGFAVRRGEALLLNGPSGVGKSTLFRAIGAIWPYARGGVSLAPQARLLMLSQKTYLPLGSLGAALAYPAGERDILPRQMCDALDKVALSHLAHRKDEVANWSDILSLGEQQRLAFARALLVRPDVLFLDEATSALDETSEAELYRLLRSESPATAVVSIGHRSSLVALHDRTVPCAWLIRANADEPARA